MTDAASGRSLRAANLAAWTGMLLSSGVRCATEVGVADHEEGRVDSSVCSRKFEAFRAQGFDRFRQSLLRTVRRPEDPDLETLWLGG